MTASMGPLFIVTENLCCSICPRQTLGAQNMEIIWSFLLKEINNSVLSYVTFYLEIDDHKPVVLSGEGMSFTCPEIGIRTLQWIIESRYQNKT